MLYITTLILFVRFVAGALDEDLQAKYETMPRHEFIEYFNKQNYSFKITQYGDEINREFGAYIDYNRIKDYYVQMHDSRNFEDLPETFDSREKWPECKTIKEVYDQGQCGSCWTFGAANTASDRTCIHKNIQVHLAEQDLQCSQERPVCTGGIASDAFEYWLEKGLVTEKCKPYDVIKLNETVCSYECLNESDDYAQDKHYAEKVYMIHNDLDNIKAELFLNGPIQASFQVFEDFFEYKVGVYHHRFGEPKGYHSVRVIGYGVEKGEDYWLVTNSWSAQWGEKGYFKVKINADELEFEDALCSGIPKS